MTKWDYHVSQFSSWSGKIKEDRLAEIAKMGEEGWELGGMATLSNTVIMVFKRPAPKAHHHQKRGWPEW